ncbi:MAG: N-methylhydantoinase [Betaproteobacteria bacterium]|nr:N-methylhydantoinase [Betaproteobacteria bacterium]
MPHNLRLAVDVGGTFTDLVLHDGATGAIATGKLLTTPADPSIAIIDGTRRLLERQRKTPADLALFIHATTLVTNTLIERKGAVTGLIMTRGFRDIIEMGTETRYDIYDLGIDLPPPLVPRAMRREVTERMDATGNIVAPIDLAEARKVVQELVADGATAIAVCFLHSYINSSHEHALGELMRREFPGVAVSLSSEIQPEIREFERASTTVANAYAQPVTKHHLDSLTRGLSGLGFSGRFHIMLSSGGLTDEGVAARFPVKVLESGPAAGVEAARFLGASIGIDTLVSFDMGGTTAKVGLVANGAATLSSQLEVARLHRFKKGSGLIIKSPTVELIEIGAGGGSIARIDQHGLLKVGPDSAGAEPGPVCYGRGGDQLTVTDANLVLGYLDPDDFAGKEMSLDTAAASAAAGRLAKKLNITAVDVAWGVHEIANENMATAARIHLVERGKDPATFTFVAFGGAGPLHAQAVARKLGVKKLIIPRNAGVMSAVGLLAAPLSFEVVRSHLIDLAAVDWTDVDRKLTAMSAEARGYLGVDKSIAFEIVRTADMRYRGQGSECTITLPAGVLTVERAQEVRQAFFDGYDDLYGRHLEEVPVQFVNFRVRVVAHDAHFELGRAPRKPGPAKRVATRPAYFPDADGYIDTAIYQHGDLDPGATFEGPAIVQSGEFSAVVGPRQACTVDDYRNLVIAF